MASIAFGVCVKDLCRLCAKNDDFAKDLLDVSNKDLKRLVFNFFRNITISEDDKMSTKICLNCEEKMVSFHLFLLNCNKMQSTLRSLASDFYSPPPEPVKTDDFTLLSQEIDIKTEVKDEEAVADDDIVSAIANDDFADLNADDYDNEALDEVTIASLKKIKKKHTKRKTTIKTSNSSDSVPVDQNHHPDDKGNLRVKDYINMTCHICNEQFENWTGLYNHSTLYHDGAKPIVLCSCGEEIRSQSKIYRHMIIHSGKSKNSNKEGEGERIKLSTLVDFDCYICHKTAPSYFYLQRHTQKSHKTTPVVKCKLCGMFLKSKTILYKHVANHNNPNVFFCDQCPKFSTNVVSLEKHKRRHVPKEERKFICDTCSKVFNNKDTLRSHTRSHIPIEQRRCYECDICSCKFTSTSSVRSHKKVVHEKVKPYVCDLCGFSFSTGGELHQHRAIHSDEKPFVCSKCSKSFKTRSNLKTHMDIHEGTSYPCYVCNRVLNSRRTLRKHLLVHQSEYRHVCDFCNRAFKRRQTLKTHLSIHTGDKPLSCKWCDERFAYASTLRSHRLRYHPEKMPAHSQHNTYSSYREQGTTNGAIDDIGGAEEVIGV